MSAREPRIWTEGEFSVVVVRVKGVGKREWDADDVPGNAWMTVEPLATLAGSFDPSADRRLKVTFYEYGDERGLPRQGTVAVAVFRTKAFVVNEDCDFMPNGVGIMEITGFGDAKLLQTINTLREERAKGPLPPPTTSTTQPS
jgi:hypothetical protein